MTLPFKMIQKTDMEKYRAETFWTKEPETIEWIKSFDDTAVLFDIGANIGIYSLYCAAIHPESQVLAFEPHPANFRRLFDNVMYENAFNGRVTCYKYMIADRVKEQVFHADDMTTGSSGGQMCKPDDGNHDTTWSVDELVFYSFDFPIPHHVKIDIDGQELSVVRGMMKTLAIPALKSVLVEIDISKGTDYYEIADKFFYHGFTMDNRFNKMKNHSRVRREKEGIQVENVVFTR